MEWVLSSPLDVVGDAMVVVDLVGVLEGYARQSLESLELRQVLFVVPELFIDLDHLHDCLDDASTLCLVYGSSAVARDPGIAQPLGPQFNQVL